MQTFFSPWRKKAINLKNYNNSISFIIPLRIMKMMIEFLLKKSVGKKNTRRRTKYFDNLHKHFSYHVYIILDVVGIHINSQEKVHFLLNGKTMLSEREFPMEILSYQFSFLLRVLGCTYFQFLFHRWIVKM